MSAGIIKVTPEQLHETSARFTAGAGSIDSTLADLNGRVSALGDVWVGQASGRFNALYQQWQTSANQLRQALEGISQLTAQAGSAYAESEASIAASFGAS